MENKAIIIFDGICNLCIGSVNFIIKHDKKAFFKFVSSQSQQASQIINKYKIDNTNLKTIVLIKDNIVFTKSSAVIEICKNLDGYWKIFSIAKYIPLFFRDWVYMKIARNRYEWFGKKENCLIPSKEIKKRFM